MALCPWGILLSRLTYFFGSRAFGSLYLESFGVIPFFLSGKRGCVRLSGR